MYLIGVDVVKDLFRFAGMFVEFLAGGWSPLCFGSELVSVEEVVFVVVFLDATWVFFRDSIEVAIGDEEVFGIDEDEVISGLWWVILEGLWFLWRVLSQGFDLFGSEFLIECPECFEGEPVGMLDCDGFAIAVDDTGDGFAVISCGVVVLDCPGCGMDGEWFHVGSWFSCSSDRFVG